jgi:hypothetical protein
MTKENLVSLDINPADQAAILDALTVLNKLLLPHLLELTVDEKLSMPKMKDKTMAFVNKAYDHSVGNPILVPAYVDVNEFDKDLQGVHFLHLIESPLEKILKAVEDTKMEAGSEAYIAALSFYNSVKVAAKNNVPGAQVVYDDLKNRFEGQGRTKPKPPVQNH